MVFFFFTEIKQLHLVENVSGTFTLKFSIFLETYSDFGRGLGKLAVPTIGFANPCACYEILMTYFLHIHQIIRTIDSVNGIKSSNKHFFFFLIHQNCFTT